MRLQLSSALLLAVLVLVAVIGATYLESTILRYIAPAPRVPDGMHRGYARRYEAILARVGVTVEG